MNPTPLSKQICRKCRNETAWGLWHEIKPVRLEWNKKDEQRWKQKKIICTKLPMKTVQNNTEAVLEKCPYIMEHIIMSQNNTAKTRSENSISSKTPKNNQKTNSPA